MHKAAANSVEKSVIIRDRMIVCIASSWDYDPTSKHHIMRLLSQNNHVLWINYHGSRTPALSGPDVLGCISALRRMGRGLQKVAPTFWQFTPLVIPGATGPWLGRLHQQLLIDQIRRAVHTLDPARKMPVQIWTFAPDVSFLERCLGEECLVYYCVDEYTRFAGFHGERIAELESKLIAAADLVIATSPALRDAKKEKRADVQLVPHGVDYDHFAVAWRDRPTMPPDLGRIRRPIFGFFGLIHHWFDVDLLVKAAALRPNYSFVLIGDCKVDPGPLRSCPNVFLLGRRDYATLPAYCTSFSAGLLPFVCNEMTRCVNPIKLLEYLAAGLPVVATAIPAAQEIGGPVAVARNAEEFAAACDAALTLSSADRPQISRLAEAHTWESRLIQISEMVLRAVRPGVRAGVQPQPVNAAVSRRNRQGLEALGIHPAH